ncbi:Tatdn1, partial [Symbiodinium pilosum]
VCKLLSIMAALALWDDLRHGLKCYTGPRNRVACSLARAAAPTPQTQFPVTMTHGLVDIGANLLDPMFKGVYREKSRHPADLSAVLFRARQAGVTRIMVTAGSLQESRDVLQLCQQSLSEGDWPQLCCTVGVHPTRCSEFDESGSPAKHMHELRDAALSAGSFLCAIGECGLDYDRLEFCPREVQKEYFEKQLKELAIPMRKPLFLHCRTSEAAEDLLALLRKHQKDLPQNPGVVHSFDGSYEDAAKFISLGFFIGLNGCSLKTEENLAMVRSLPDDCILLETDAPWCGIKASHAGHDFVRSTWDEVKKPERWEEGKCVKDRCEPCQMRQVLEVVAGCRSMSPEALAKVVLQNSNKFMGTTAS